MASSTLRKRVGLLFLAFWVPAITVVTATLMSSHVVAMPEPRDAEKLHDALQTLAPGPGRRLVHLVPDDCSCTNNLLRHLLERGAEAPAEYLVFLGHRAGLSEKAVSAGYRYRELSAGVAESRLSLQAAPVLAVLQGSALSYAGGYFDEPAAVHARTERILAGIDAGRPPEGLPIFGCVLTEELRRRTDPFGLKRLEAVGRGDGW